MHKSFMSVLGVFSSAATFIILIFILVSKESRQDNLPVKSLPEVVRIDVYDNDDNDITYQLGVFVTPNLILMDNRVKGQKFYIKNNNDSNNNDYKLKLIKEEKPFRLFQTNFINDKWVKFAVTIYQPKICIVDFPNLNRHVYDSEIVSYNRDKNQFIVKGQMYLGAVVFDKDNCFMGLGNSKSKDEKIICHDLYLVKQFLNPSSFQQ